MLKTRRFPTSRLLYFGLASSGLPTAWAAVVFVLYALLGIEQLRIPFQPLSTMGIAVAFYVGFKNNSSYGRFWEGRKIWGGIVNVSRAWAAGVLAYVDGGADTPASRETKRQLIHRHLAYINALRLQLRKNSRFFDKPAKSTARRLQRHAEHMRNDWDAEISPFLSKEEHAEFAPLVNPATHMAARQGQHLAELVEAGRLDMFRQLELMGHITEFYTLQGKAERIKNTPFPRQYAEYSRVFTRVFVFLVPLGMLDVFADHIHQVDAWSLTLNTHNLAWALPMVAASALVSWVFMTMEGIGDSSEDPFERSMNDVPMNALCVAIERDLRQLLGETEVRGPEEAADGILY